MLSTFHPAVVTPNIHLVSGSFGLQAISDESDRAQLTHESLAEILKGTLDSLKVTFERGLSPSDVALRGLDSDE